MKAGALLYIFYGSPHTCASRVRLLRKLNPTLKIYGICTAGSGQRKRFKIVEELLDDLWYLPEHPPKWCWFNLDKVACQWFLVRGRNLVFNKILVVDWDALLLEPVEKWLDQVGVDEVKIIDVWENSNPEINHWTSTRYPEFSEFQKIFSGLHPQGWVLMNAFLFAYACSKKSFEKFAAQVVRLPGYCEFRLPTVMTANGLKLSTFERPGNWSDFASVGGISIRQQVIRDEMARPDGFRLFHPVYEPYFNQELSLSWRAWIMDWSWWRTYSRIIKNLIKHLRKAIGIFLP